MLRAFPLILCMSLTGQTGASLAAKPAASNQSSVVPMAIQPFSPEASDLSEYGFKPYPLEGRVNALLDQPAPGDWRDSRQTRNLYLDLSERIVRLAVHWVDERGAVIDPVIGKEWAQTTPRFVSSAAVLIYFGRCTEYLDIVCKSMALCCKRLADGSAESMSPDFWMRELMTADMCLQGVAPPSLVKAWRKDLSKVDPERVNKDVDPKHGPNLEQLHNWSVYAAGGEALRELAGLGPADRTYVWGSEYFDIYMAHQYKHMTDWGMYRDPGDPVTYDITTRLQFITPLAYGFESPLRDRYVELQRRGCLTALLFTAADGYVPYGGRSSQFQFQEAILSAMFELEARRYKGSAPELAGAFKRQAHRSALATKRWLMEMEPARHLKNGFAPDSRHGIDGYGQYSVYSLLCSSFLGLAALYADDTIKEAPTPAELGGYTFELPGAFHKIFAVSRNTYVEIDTAADLHYDATGIGRVHFAGTPLEMVLGMPFSNDPHYVLSPGEKPARQPIAIAPAWDSPNGRITLAGLSGKDLSHTTVIHRQSPDEVSLTVNYRHDASQSRIAETLTLTPNSLTVRTAITVDGRPAESVAYPIPILLTDGQSSCPAVLEDGRLHVEYLGHHWEIEWDARQAKAILSPNYFANRNGRYRQFELQFGDRPVAFTIRNLGSADKPGS